MTSRLSRNTNRQAASSAELGGGGVLKASANLGLGAGASTLFNTNMKFDSAAGASPKFDTLSSIEKANSKHSGERDT